VISLLTAAPVAPVFDGKERRDGHIDFPDFDLSGAQVSPGSRGRGDESFHLGDRS
jgi:hypothetical protein